jgi:hypothetical protein
VCRLRGVDTSRCPTATATVSADGATQITERDSHRCRPLTGTVKARILILAPFPPADRSDDVNSQTQSHPCLGEERV